MTDLSKRMSAAIDVLKAGVSNDRCTMVSVLERYKRATAFTPDAITLNAPNGAINRRVTELALDILCGEQPI